MTASFYTGSRATEYRKPKLCVYCKDSHSPNDCRTVPNTDQRYEIAKRDKLCFNCLGKHRASDCKSKFSCRICKKRHHTSLCKGITTSTSESPHTSRVASQPTSQTHVNFTATANPFKGPVLLKTAVAEVSAGSEMAIAVILFDEGATRSFVTRRFTQKLNLNPDKQEATNLSTFGDTNSRTRWFDVSSFTLHMINGRKMNISALTIPQISTPTKNLVNRSLHDLPYLRNLKFAHPAPEVDSFEISILIGADFYWDIVGDHIIRGPGPTAVSSKLGYLLSGPTDSRQTNDHAFDATILYIATNSIEEENIPQRF
ncbi:uncharacterized protein LOC144352224 [Saccoglossus kowalevskii]